ncbi:hypothetical protein BCR36DRAFT_417020 [Piromyces finnis]|uniref:Ribosomal protein 60S n=1 Tax=Piromyces finnis TaxID=1754191 RepID=A0A1Y1UL69_9FUNG|nr:hypothetical protein BCR36DRAFT_417020 [Piromyces finnis]|eukprot:ORX38800.1 hypothetical protein BCR36DRAFT_417020 [Piromyces finnis]
MIGKISKYTRLYWLRTIIVSLHRKGINRKCKILIKDIIFILIDDESAYLLATLGGASPSAADVKKIINTIGAEVDDEKVDAVVAALNGKDIDEVIADGFSKLSAAPVASGSAASGAAASGAGAAAEETKEESEEEESDSDMGFGLFD